MTTKIIGTGSYLPEHVVSNDDLAKLVDTVMNGSLPGQGFETDELQRRKVEQIWQQLRQRKH